MTLEDINEINILVDAGVPIDKAILLVNWSKDKGKVSMADVECEKRAITLAPQRRDRRFPEKDGWELHILEDGSQAYFNKYTNKVWYCYRGG
jgi:hypothetical protein